MSFDGTLAIASAQMRSVRRSVRTWVFGALAGGTTLGVCVFQAYAHGVLGSANAGRLGPRLLIGEFGVYLLWLLLVGVVFLASDDRNRDLRAGIVDTLDTRPISNLVLICGRVLGLVAAVAMPMLATVVVLQLAGHLARAVDFWMGDPIEPVSLASFVLLDVLVALVVWCAVVTLLSAALRNRLVVVVVAGMLLALQFWAMTVVPVYLLRTVSVVSNTVGWASDIVPRFADLDTLVQRGSVLVLAGGLCAIAAALHPRLDGGSRGRRMAWGMALVAMAATGVGSVAWRGTGMVEQRTYWLVAHRAAVGEEHRTRPDIEGISGTVRIDPGELLEIDVDLRLGALDRELRSLVFSFNPAMRIAELHLDGDEPSYTHEAGLLTVQPAQPLAAGSTAVLSVRASGIPDPDFAYLDGALDWRRLPATNLLKYLGTQASLFHRNYVALMPAIHWLPAAGANVHREDPSKRPLDFYQLDLVVDVPKGWIAAGPGRQWQADGAPTRFRFRPVGPVQEVGLITGVFERRAVEVNGIELELLVSRKHMPNLDYYAEAGDAIGQRLVDLLTALDAAGLPYRDTTLSLVEVPAPLRTYRGGWRLDAIRAPGILLLREETLPMARTGYYDNVLGSEERQENLASYLFIYFLNDWQGGNVLQGLADNLLASTGPSGDAAVALDVVCRELVYQVSRGNDYPVWFSAHQFDTEAYFGTSAWDGITSLAAGHFGSMLSRTYPDPDIWDLLGRTSLAEIDGQGEPGRLFGVLWVKGSAMAGAIFDQLGVHRTGALLGALRRRHEGSTFTRGDFVAIASEAGFDLTEIVNQGLDQGPLPGFLASPVNVVRLADDETGQPRYQLNIHLRNDEPVDGWVKLGSRDFSGEGEPIRVPANSSVEIGMVVDAPPNQFWVSPYLSLNRHEVRLEVLDGDPDVVLDQEPLVGPKPSEWLPPVIDGVVVDDLDAGFSTESDTGIGAGWRLMDLYRGWSPTLDGGLPDAGRRPTEWFRRSVPSSWGKYRHTIAQAKSGNGAHRALFAAELPAGRWRLDYHLPEGHIPAGYPGDRELAVLPLLGSMDLKLVVGALPGRPGEPSDSPVEEWTIDFDAALAEPGWNKLGEFEVPGGEIRLVISNRSSGVAVVADAIRWRRVD